jgi:hypothetical protein
VFDDIGDATDVARDHGHLVTHRLEEHDAEPFGVAPSV